MQAAHSMADNLTDQTLRTRAALALGRLAHALVRLILAAVLLGTPALLLALLWRWLAG